MNRKTILLKILFIFILIIFNNLVVINASELPIIYPKKNISSNSVDKKSFANSNENGQINTLELTQNPIENKVNIRVKIDETPPLQVFPNNISMENGTFNIHVINFSVIDLLNTVFEKNNREIMISSKIQEKVSINLTNVTPDELLELLSKDLGFNWSEKDGIYIVSTEEQLIYPKFFPIKYANLNDIKETLNALGMGDKLIINSYPRGILVNASPNKLRTVSDIIDQLDRSSPSIKVEFKIVELTKEEEKKIGISWQDVTGTYTYNNQAISSSPIATITKNLTTGIVATMNETNSIGKVLSKPYIIALNNTEAHLLTGDEVPIFSKDTNSNPTVEYKKIGIELYATPSVVNINDKILNIKAKVIVNIINGQQTQQGLTAPKISSREAQTIMNIKSGETIVIGGLLKSEDIRSEVGIPLLNKLPIIGGLFKSTIKSKTNTEIIIFITPTLIDAN